MSRRLGFSFVLAVMLAGVLTSAIPALAEGPSRDEGATASTQTPRFVVYYFHGDMRCATCRKLEAYSKEAITAGFADELERGALVFRVVNVDEERNKHFVKDFQMTNKSVVVVEYKEGEVARFENLNRIWQKVGDKDGFLEYVRTSTREFIGEG